MFLSHVTNQSLYSIVFMRGLILFWWKNKNKLIFVVSRSKTFKSGVCSSILFLKCQMSHICPALPSPPFLLSLIGAWLFLYLMLSAASMWFYGIVCHGTKGVFLAVWVPQRSHEVPDGGMLNCKVYSSKQIFAFFELSKTKANHIIF